MVSSILAIIKFLVSELPKFIAQWKLYSKDKKYNSTKEKVDASLKAYQEKASIDALKKIEDSQK